MNCNDEQRRHRIRARGLNGLDYLEVSDDQLVLSVYFLGQAPDDIDKIHVRIEGGSARPVNVLDVQLCRDDDPDEDDCMKVVVDRPGDFSPYTLRVVEVDERGRPTGPYRGFDPRYAQLTFSFKEGCANDLDCRPEAVCLDPQRDTPEINYLARDYASFRQLILDRMALTLPEWRDRHVPDVGIALVELLAYVGDHLSYNQDAVATEGYLGTARRRISLRRHTRLVDYQMHEGCNARAWVCVDATSTVEDLPADRMLFVTRPPGKPFGTRGVLPFDEFERIPPGQYQVFEPVEHRRNLAFYAEHSRIEFYPWGERQCCLPRGATSATLRDHWERVDRPSDPGQSYPTPYKPDEAAAAPAKDKPSQDKGQPGGGYEPAPPAPELVHVLRRLAPGDVLIFEEVIGPVTGAEADADPMHRHAVRLTRVEFKEDTLYPDNEYDPRGTPVVEIEWHPDDALPFALCISALVPDKNASTSPECEGGLPCRLAENVSIARGNVVLVDHGRTIRDEPLGTVGVERVLQKCDEEGRAPIRVPLAARFEPALQQAPLTFSGDVDGKAAASQTVAATASPRSAHPAVALHAIPPSPGTVGPRFEPADLVDPSRVAQRVKALSDAGALYLCAAFTEKTQQLIDGLAGDAALSEPARKELAIELRAALEPWMHQPDLLASGADNPHFVVEIDDEGRAHLRFGDGENGRQPAPGTAFLATYRVGNGQPGNVGAEAIAHLVLREVDLSGANLSPRNPLGAMGGVDAEPLDDVRMFAPHAARAELARAVTADDYARLTERRFADVQGAAAALRWTGSRYQATVAVDERGTADPRPELLRDIAADLHRVGRIGHDIAVSRARQVPLDIELSVCVHPSHVRGHVEAALRQIFGTRLLPDGSVGMFHPDRLTFGQGIYLSALVAAAQALDGVESVEVMRLQRLFEAPAQEIETGVLQLGPFEVARVDNDSNFPERGRIAFKLRGGR